MKGSGSLKQSKSKLKGKSSPKINLEKKKKEAEILHEIISHIDHCTGCLKPGHYEPSHIIPRSRSKALRLDPENITNHCRECHLIFETHSLEKIKVLKDFERNMEYIRRKDKEFYNSIINS